MLPDESTAALEPPDHRASHAGFGPKFDEALALAADAHRDQKRKGSGIPYIGHLLGVCALVIEEGGDETEAIAALLHDIVEDQGGEDRLREVEVRFAPAVARIVEACSDRIDESEKLPWKERKQRYLRHLESAPPDALLVSLADKLYNARSIERDHAAVGEAVWERFNADRGDTLWYYRALAECFARRMPESRMTGELAATVAALERVIGE